MADDFEQFDEGPPGNWRGLFVRGDTALPKARPIGNVQFASPKAFAGARSRLDYARELRGLRQKVSTADV